MNNSQSDCILPSVTASTVGMCTKQNVSYPTVSSHRITLTFATLIDVLSHAAELFSSYELSFITSSTHDSFIQTNTFSSFNQKHGDDMAAVWACLLAGCVLCLQPALSAQGAHNEAQIVYITNVTRSVTWLVREPGGDLVRSMSSPSLELQFSKVIGIVYGLTSESNILNLVGFDHVARSLEMHVTPLLQVYQCHFFLPTSFSPNLPGTLEREQTFDLSSITHINSGGEAVISETAKAFHCYAQESHQRPLQVVLCHLSWFRVISLGFGATETCAGCIDNSSDVFVLEPKFEFLELGAPSPGCEMRTHGFRLGSWYSTDDMGIILDGSLRLGGRFKKPSSFTVSPMVFLGSRLVSAPWRVSPHSFLATTPHRAPGQQTDGFVTFYSPSLDLDGEDASFKLSATHRAMRGISVKMVTLPPSASFPFPSTRDGEDSDRKAFSLILSPSLNRVTSPSTVAHAEELLGEARGASFVTPANGIEKTLARIYTDLFNSDVADVSAADNFFGLVPYIDALKAKSVTAQEYAPIVPLNLTGDKTPVFVVHPGVGEMVSSAVKRTQPRGGVVAFDVAKRLEVMGEVKSTGLIHILPYIADRLREIDWHLVELQLIPETLNHWVDVAGSLIECGKEFNPSGSICSKRYSGTVLKRVLSEFPALV
ncbi:hypothetical protein OG21DRAFT_1478637 [Imleria badia]|nr:hypothetical protein OG21DRAFT_1478637 [Imleria badia]